MLRTLRRIGMHDEFQNSSLRIKFQKNSHTVRRYSSLPVFKIKIQLFSALNCKELKNSHDVKKHRQLRDSFKQFYNQVYQEPIKRKKIISHYFEIAFNASSVYGTKMSTKPARRWFISDFGLFCKLSNVHQIYAR